MSSVWDNITTPLREHPIGHYFRNSLFVGVSVTLLNLLTCSLAGYSFAKFRYWVAICCSGWFWRR